MYFLKAQIAQARGNNGEAIRALREARTLDAQRNSTPAVPAGAPPAGPGLPAPTPLTPGGPAAPSTPGPNNPFHSSQLFEPPSLLAGRVAAATDAWPAVRGERTAQLRGELL
jgi:hypothetical protein